jgi:F-type H+-transporting ATPase subunit gamma
MPSLKDLRIRIASVKSTQKITKAMKMVAASKLRRAQEAAIAARPYAAKIEAMVASLARSVAGQDGAPRLLVGTGSDKVHLLIVATAERGLCGAFNSSIVRAVRKHVMDLRQGGKEVKIVTVGKKGRDQLRRDLGPLIVHHFDMSASSRKLSFEAAAPIAEHVTKMYEAGEFDVATLFYNHFKSAISQIVTAQQLVPCPVPDVPETAAASNGPSAVYEYEPDEAGILEALLPRNLAVQVYKALLENAASEQGARMAAMDNATRNAGDMINRLTIFYNRTRQAYITKELIEIVSGAEAL